MTVTPKNDVVTYKSGRGDNDTVRPADMVVVVNPDGTNIGGTGADNLGKAEDASHASGDVGVMALAVRKDTAAAFGADGDYTPVRVDQYGDVNTLVVDTTGVPITYNANGQATMANSAPVAIASNQSRLTVGGIVSTGTLPVYTDTQGANILQAANGGVGLAFGQPGTAGADGATQVIFGVGRSDTTWTNVRPLGVAGWGYNGSTWDRVRLNTAANGGAAIVENGPYSFGRVTADGQIKGSAGFIHSITIAPTTATPTAGLLTVYNNTAESGTVVYSEWIFATTPGHTVILDAACSTGIYVGYDAALANVSCTVSYR